MFDIKKNNIMILSFIYIFYFFYIDKLGDNKKENG